MVVPWIGFPLGDLLKRFKPTSKAKFVEFKTLVRPETDARPALLACSTWPYVEGLRIDEAMHPLAIMAVGLYGKALPNQNGAPLRLIVPWKYGFKGIKSIVGIKFAERMPRTTWAGSAPDEYGFLCQREPRGGSSALEPGERAAHRRQPVRLAPSHPAVQRLRRSGGRPLQRHGPAEIFLNWQFAPDPQAAGVCRVLDTRPAPGRGRVRNRRLHAGRRSRSRLCCIPAASGP